MQESPKDIPTIEKPKKKRLKYIFSLLLLLLCVCVCVFFALRLPVVQTQLTQQLIKYAEQKLGTEIDISTIKVDIFNDIYVENFLVRDEQKDTLLFAKELKIDIDKLKILDKKLHINNIELNGTYLNLYALNDSTFNYQFIADAFSTNKKTEEKQETDQDEEAVNIDLKLGNILLNNTKVIYKDVYKYIDLLVDMPTIDFEADNFDIEKKEITAQYLHIEQPNIFLTTYNIDDNDTDTTLTYLPNLGIDLKIADLQLTQGTFSLLGENPSYTNSGYIEWDNLDLSNINIIAENTAYIADSVSTTINNINFNEISGFKVNEFKGDFLITKKDISLNSIRFKTAKSTVSGQMLIRYHSFEDFLDYENTVYQDISLNNSQLNFSDVEYFVPLFSKNEIAERLQHFRKANIKGRVYGKVNNLKGKNIVIESDNSFFAGGFRIKGLPKVENTFIDFDVDRLSTSIDRITTLLPQLGFPKEITKLGKLDFSGNFLGFVSDFVARGELQTDMGKAITNLNMKLLDTENANYSGDLQVIDFKLGEFLDKNKQIGNISFDTKINGSGLTLSQLSATVDGTIQKIDFNGYTYKNIMIDGKLDKMLFDGDFRLKQDDVNIEFSGLVDLAKQTPVYRFNTQVVRLDLQKLNFSQQPYVISFTSDLNLTGTNIDDFQGSAKLENITIEKNGETYPIASADIVSTKNKADRELKIESDIADIKLKGNFGFQNLSNTFKEYLTNYFPYNIQYNDTLAVRDLAIDFDIKLKKTTNITQLFLPELETVEGGGIKGKFNNRSRYLNMESNIPAIDYNGIHLENIHIDALSDDEELIFNLNVDTLRRENIAIPYLIFEGFVRADTLDLHLTANTDTSKNRLDAHGFAVVKDKMLSVQIDSMLLKVAGQDWHMQDENMYFQNWENYALPEWELAFQEQYFRLSSYPNPTEKYPEALIEFNDINLKNYLELASVNQELKASGVLNGSISIQDFLKNPLFTGDLTIDEAVILNQSMGKIMAKAIKQANDDKIDITADIQSDLYNTTAKGYYNLEAKAKEPLYIEAQVDRFSLVFLEAFLGGQIYDTEGTAEGRISIAGDIKAPKVNGELKVRDAETSIKLLETTYAIDNDYIVFEDNKLYFDAISLRDKFDNYAELNGYFDLADFSSLAVSVDITTDKFLLLDTKRTASPDQLYYGTAMGQGFLIFDGPIDDIYMYLNLETLENTKLFLPLSYDYGVGENTVYSFIAKDTLQTVEEQIEKAFDFKIDMDFAITPLAELQLIFDYQAGDIIKANGDGNIQMDYDSRSEIFDIFGEYTITEGDYLFTLQNVINKRFDIKQGSTINFYGDPYKAILDIETYYSLKTSLYELLNNPTNDTDDELRQRVPVELYLNLSNELASPDIDFAINVPETSFNSANSSARDVLEQLNNDVDKNELNKQVFGLMVFNKFLPANTDLFGNEYLTSSVSTTMSEFLSNQFSNFLSETIGELIPNSEWGVNWRNYTTTNTDATDLDGTLYNRNEIELTYRQKLFNNRVIIDLGGNFDLGESNDDSYDNVALAGDFVVQYKITPDGFYRVKIFAETDTDIFTGRYNKTGISLSVTEDFDSLKDLLSILKKRRTVRKQKRK